MRRGWECELGFQLVLRPVAATHHITTTIHGACQALLLLLWQCNGCTCRLR